MKKKASSTANRLLTQDQIQRGLLYTNLTRISEKSGLSLSMIWKLKNKGSAINCNNSTIITISEFLISEHEEIANAYGLK